MQMEKMVIFHRLNDENMRPALERWFRKNHIPDTLTQTPWTVKYVMYRACPPPPGAENLATYNYRLHESYAIDYHERRGAKGLLAMEPEPGNHAITAQIMHIPAEPTEDFMGGECTLLSRTILRWVCAYRWPKNADKKKCEDWYLNVHVPEIMKQPGLTRFFSHKAIEFEGSPLPLTTELNADELDAIGWLRHWDRVSEMWYENNNGWVESNITNPPQYTKPDFATLDTFPFFKPEEDFVSCFILETPDLDMTKQMYPGYF